MWTGRIERISHDSFIIRSASLALSQATAAGIGQPGVPPFIFS